ncbi:hypothetical protein VTP01DRAFT_5697 [Rhizomucor pusillus]|uniref:uncharacterized protein n=1 Tax=Rhizomucor pusillus TaxID=4840 RepID=UPI003741F89A
MQNRISIVQSPIDQQKFVILDAPTEETLPDYLDTLLDQNVTEIVRICDRRIGNTYNADDLQKRTGIKVIDDITFEDGGVPSTETVDRWLTLTHSAKERGTAIAVHCVAGIGRAPVLVTLSLVESGMDPLDAIEYIRKHRRGALNRNQLRYIDSYKSRRRKSKGLSNWFKFLN